MKRDTVIRLAREAGGTPYTNRHVDGSAFAFSSEKLDAFAALVEAEALKSQQQAINAAVMAEREACAELCDSMKTTRLPGGDDDVERGFNGGLRRASSYIRARTHPMRIPDAHKEDGL